MFMTLFWYLNCVMVLIFEIVSSYKMPYTLMKSRIKTVNGRTCNSQRKIGENFELYKRDKVEKVTSPIFNQKRD